MPRFKIEVSEHISNYYEPVWIEAEDETEARERAEEMRVQGALESLTGDCINDVEFDILEEVDDEVEEDEDDTEVPDDNIEVCACGFNLELCSHKQEVGGCKQDED